MAVHNLVEKAFHLVYGDDAFAREDEGDDRSFYFRPRLVSHLDDRARATVRRLIGTLVTEDRPDVLDLMASWESHLPQALRPGRMVGLGLNAEELEANPALTERFLHDLNAEPGLPFADAAFDVVLNTVSVDYLTRPFEVFAELGRVLRPGGLLLVTFSNRMFPTKAVKVWRDASESERLLLVEDFVRRAGLFEAPRVFLSKGRPRPSGDRYADTGLPSDPIYAVYADRLGGDPARPPRPEVDLDDDVEPPLAGVALARREGLARETRSCPHCGERLLTYAVPNTPFVEWDCDHMYICFNDRCPFLIRGWSSMHRQGNHGYSNRVMLHPERSTFGSVPVVSLLSLRDGIVQE